MYNLCFYLEKKYEQNVLIKTSRFKNNNKHWSKSFSSSIRLVGTELLWISAKCLCFGSFLCVDYTGTRPSWEHSWDEDFASVYHELIHSPPQRLFSTWSTVTLSVFLSSSARETWSSRNFREVCLEGPYEMEFCFMRKNTRECNLDNELPT